MRYQFPVIRDIQQVKDAIAWHESINGGKTEFFIAEREGYLVANYLVSMPGTFPDVDHEHATVLRELRGLTFYPEGAVAARKFHKFFNLNERRETEFRKIDWTLPHVILEKLDGSMLTPFLRKNGQVEWHTKMGKTDVADMSASFIEKNPQYNEFAKQSINQGFTPIFEFCSRKNRIVVDHPNDRLVLLASRNNVTGQYVKYDILKEAAEQWGIEVVKQYEGNIETMEQFIEEARAEPDIEGYVIRFDDGHMLKVKADVYVTLHRAVSQLQQEKDVWRLVLEDKVDDLKAILPDDQRDRLDEFQMSLDNEVMRLTASLTDEFNAAIANLDEVNLSMFEDSEKERKRMFAVNCVNQNETLDHRIRNLMFAMYDGKPAFELVKNFLINQTTTRTKVEKIRNLVNGVKWEPTEE